MNKQKGFTLIEIIGVITILSLMLLVAVPSLTKSLKRTSQKKYDDYIDNLKIASENYVVGKLKEGKEVNYMTLGDLIDKGYINNVITNPENNKNLSRDTRIKVTKELDNTFAYDVQEYYNLASDYNNDDLIIHYDSVEYSPDNIFKSLTSGTDYSYTSKGYWTEEGVYLNKDNSNTKVNLKKTYDTENITISFSIKSLDELNDGGSDYTYPVLLYKDNTEIAKIGFRKKITLFYKSGHNTVLSLKEGLSKDKNYTMTFVQEGLSTRKVYINGVLITKNTAVTGTSINYNAINISPNLYNLKLNNILIYNRALSADEIKELYELDKERFGE